MGALSLMSGGEVAEESGADRPILQRCLPSRSPDSMPVRAVRGVIPRSRSQSRWSKKRLVDACSDRPGPVRSATRPFCSHRRGIDDHSVPGEFARSG